ncbi:hypothetical protein [Amycolatopsis thailandensis]|uniref:hypothetical protein n=1 Tax=Amycolatopsis thailandensis TaxID=589330 RepID=UPI003631B623
MTIWTDQALAEAIAADPRTSGSTRFGRRRSCAVLLSPRRGSLSRAAGYEWRGFLYGAVAHLYRRAQLAPDADWPPMLLPWCEENRPEPRRHERGSISRNRVSAPSTKTRCPLCRDLLIAAKAEARSGLA